MNSKNAILGLLTETSLHAGAGQALGVIDLPIQREAHTSWPCVFGSAVKGALRARAEDAGLDDVEAIFGPELDKKGDKIEFAGALSVGDARLLLLPVRSLTTHFRWVTCPAALRRFQRDTQRLGIAKFDGFKVPGVDGETALVAEPAGDWLYLEEYRFKVDATQAESLDKVVAALAGLLPDGLEGPLKKQLAIVADDGFRHLAEHATPVHAHVRLDENKTVARGALWYEESLPPETLLYVGLNAVDARTQDSALKAAEVLGRVRDGLFGKHPYLQLGGNETVGMGWCGVRYVTGSEG